MKPTLKHLMLAPLLALVSLLAMGLTSCSDDDENQQNTWPSGQWIYEGHWLDYDNINAVLLEFSGTDAAPQFNILARSAVNGLWYDYPHTATFSINLSTGTVTSGGTTFCTYQLKADVLTLTIQGRQYPFVRTHGITNNGGAVLPSNNSHE